MLSDNTKKLLEKINKLYNLEISENGLEKEIGHGIEHIKGVVKRAARISQTIPENERDKNFDDIVAAVAALHDIGNLIERKGHNVYSGAFIRKGLKISDIPMAYNSDNPLQKGDFKDAQNMALLFFLKTHFTNEEFESVLENLNTKKVNILLEKISEKIYNENILADNTKKPDPNTIEEILFDKLQEMSMQKEDLRFLSRDQLLCIEEIQNLIDTSFTPQEKDLIIKAVEDHNRDFEIDKFGKEDKSHPRTAANIYGKIVFDADKDDTLETFIIRSYLYVKNELAKKDNNLFVDKEGKLIEKRVIDDILSQMLVRFAPSKESLSRIGYENLDIEVPSFVHPSSADPFSMWDFAEHDKEGNVVCTYNDMLCYIKTEKDGEKYTVYSTSSSTPLFDLKVDKETRIPIIPDEMLIHASLSGGRDVRFQLPLPKDKASLEDRMKFFKDIAFYGSDFNYTECYNYIKGVIDQVRDMTPEQAIDFFENPDSLEQVALKYDAYKETKEEYNKRIDISSLNSKFLPPLNALITMVKREPGEYKWETVNMLYEFTPQTIYSFSKEAKLKTFLVNSKESDKAQVKKDYLKNLEEEYGKDFLKVFKSQINECFNEYILGDLNNTSFWDYVNEMREEYIIPRKNDDKEYDDFLK